MATLAIRGHETRGKEVIEILTMLGGANGFHREGNNKDIFYYIDKNSYIETTCGTVDYILFDLEQFEEKFPYKVGDKVSSKFIKNRKIEKMEWTDTTNRVVYKLQGIGWYSADELKPSKEESIDNANKVMFEANAQCCDIMNDIIKEETMKDKSDLLQQLKEYFDNTPREVVEKEWHEYDKYNEIKPTINEYLKYVNNIRQPQYPKTYEECCKVIGISQHDVEIDLPQPYQQKMFKLFKLLICRDAYWKIAGDEMGLGKPWNPCDAKDRYIIRRCTNEILKGHHISCILEFPTEEMRDTFYENFKDLIEECKELL